MERDITDAPSGGVPAIIAPSQHHNNHHHHGVATRVCRNPLLCSLLLIHTVIWGTADAGLLTGGKYIGSGVGFECGGVFLTVSSLWRPVSHGRGVRESELELNWDKACTDSPDWAIPEQVGLFTKNPILEPNTPPEVLIEISEYPEGFYRTNVSLGKVVFPGGWNKDNEKNVAIMPGPHCLPFWIASFNNNTLLKSNCLKIQPTWMFDHKLQLGWLPIGSLLIPGTHNSGCFQRGSINLSRRDTLQRYLLTQDKDIWNQLVYGIRYLDFRVGYYSSRSANLTGEEENSDSNKFWINHDLVRVMPLLPLLRDIKRFLETAKGEVVILDFHRFPVGFENRPARHWRLLSMIEKELGSFAIPFKIYNSELGPTLNDIWSNDKRLIISYGNEEIAKEFDWLWGPLPQFWGDKQSTSDLKVYLQRVMTSSHRPTNEISNPLWASMAQLTPTPIDVMFKPSGSLRQMADDVNRNLTTWIRTKWWRLANIVATDYFLGNNLIDVSINANCYKLNAV